MEALEEQELSSTKKISKDDTEVVRATKSLLHIEDDINKVES